MKNEGKKGWSWRESPALEIHTQFIMPSCLVTSEERRKRGRNRERECTVISPYVLKLNGTIAMWFFQCNFHEYYWHMLIINLIFMFGAWCIVGTKN